MRAFLNRLSVALVALLVPALGWACGFHLYLPEETVVDRVLNSDHVVIARPSAVNPFRYDVVGTYKGSAHGVEIPDLVDTVSRRRLAKNKGDVVLFALETETGDWTRVAYLDQAYRSVMDEIFASMDAWSFGGERLRFQYAAQLLHHPHKGLADLALAELDRAPYGVLDQLDMVIDPALLLSDFFAPDRYKTIPIRALLLGQSGSDQARSFLHAQFEDGILPLGVTAGALAVALIEIDGVDGAEKVVWTLRQQPRSDTVTREILIEALAIHAETGEPALQRSIRSQIETLLEEDPDLAAAAARQFLKRSDWSQADTVKQASSRARDLSPADRFDISQYLSFAARASL